MRSLFLSVARLDSRLLPNFSGLSHDPRLRCKCSRIHVPIPWSLPAFLLSVFALFFPVFPSQVYVSLPSFFLSSCFCPSSRIASLLHIQLPLCSHPHPSPLLSSPLFSAARYRQSLLTSGNTLSRKQPRKTQQRWQLLGCCARQWFSVDWCWTEISLVYNAMARLLQLWNKVSFLPQKPDVTFDKEWEASLRSFLSGWRRKHIVPCIFNIAPKCEK